MKAQLSMKQKYNSLALSSPLKNLLVDEDIYVDGYFESLQNNTKLPSKDHSSKSVSVQNLI